MAHNKITKRVMSHESETPRGAQGGAFLFKKQHCSARYAYRMTPPCRAVVSCEPRAGNLRRRK